MVDDSAPRPILATLILGMLAGCGQNPNIALPVLTHHNKQTRTGVQLETVLNTSNVKPVTFGKLFTRTLPASPYSTALLKDRSYTQPLVVNNVSPSLVIVATDTNMVYAFDAQNPNAANPVWKADLGPPESAIDNWGDPHCNRSLPVIGVLGTPVITDDEKILYVVAKNRPADIKSHNVTFALHKLDAVTGQKLASTPVPKAANGFDPYHSLQRPGLLWVSNPNAAGGGYVYAAFGGHCDQRDFHGWIFGFDGNLQTQVAGVNTTPGPGEWGAGIWQAGQAPVFNTANCPNCDHGSIYVATGNGSGPLTNSVLKYQVNPDGSLTKTDSFTPFNQASMNNCDADLASSGPLVLDDYRHVVLGGKEGVIYVLDTSSLGHPVASETQANLTGTANGSLCQHNNGGGGFNTGYARNTQGNSVYQEFEVSKAHQGMAESVFGHIHGAPVSASLNGPWLRLYVWPEMDTLKQFTQIQGGKFDPKPEHESTVPGFEGMPGGMLSISSSGQIGGVILWATHPKADAWAPDPLQPQAPSIPIPIDGILYAFDAADVSKNLWNSDMRAADRMGEFSKFTPPTIANGHVYVATFSGELQVYGLCGQPSPCK